MWKKNKEILRFLSLFSSICFFEKDPAINPAILFFPLTLFPRRNPTTVETLLSNGL